MASGGSHLLLCPLPSHTGFPSASITRQVSEERPHGSIPRPPRLPTQRCQALIAAASHTLQAQEGCEVCFQDTTFPAPHQTLAICNTSARVPSL